LQVLFICSKHVDDVHNEMGHVINNRCAVAYGVLVSLGYTEDVQATKDTLVDGATIKLVSTVTYYRSQQIWDDKDVALGASDGGGTNPRTFTNNLQQMYTNVACNCRQGSSESNCIAAGPLQNRGASTTARPIPAGHTAAPGNPPASPITRGPEEAAIDTTIATPIFTPSSTTVVATTSGITSLQAHHSKNTARDMVILCVGGLFVGLLVGFIFMRCSRTLKKRALKNEAQPYMVLGEESGAEDEYYPEDGDFYENSDADDDLVLLDLVVPNDPGQFVIEAPRMPFVKGRLQPSNIDQAVL